MKILLVQHSSECIESYPAGLGLIAAVLLENGHGVSFIDLGFESNPVSELEKKIKDVSPGALGFTLFTPYYEEFKKIMSECDNLGSIKVVAGGAHACAESESTLRDGFVDIVVRFEGELIAPKLFKALENGDDLSEIDGIAYLDENGKYVQTADASYVENLDDIPPIPYELFNIKRYTGKVHGLLSATILTSRGCPYNCNFCYRGPSGTKKVRYISTAKVLDEIKILYTKYSFKAFDFHDDLFTLKKDRVIEICEGIISSGLKFTWRCLSRVNCIDREMLYWMKKAGCIGIHFGVESGSQYILDKFNKKTTLDQARNAFKLCREIKIATVAYFILGTPWDTEENVEETINFALEIKPTLSLFLSATPYPGTELRNIFLAKGLYVPENFSEYNHFPEGSYKFNKTENSARDIYLQNRELCVRATGRVVRKQLTDFLSYPRLIRGNIDLYGYKDFFKSAFKRILSVVMK